MILQTIILVISLGVLSYFITSVIIRSAGKRMMAVPNERSLHDNPVPKGGGVAIVITWFIGITFLFIGGLLESDLYFAFLCGIPLALISFMDDVFDIRPSIRLIIHFATAIAAFAFLGGLRPLIMPEVHFNYDYIVYPLAVIGMVWFINLYNFMDGADGFASVEAIFVSAVFYIMTGNLTSVLLIFCVAGFLYWNWPKARIFMGDTGSTQLGFILVVMGIYFHNSLKFSILNWIMLTSPFWFDATITLFRRWMNHEKLNEAHRRHVYQRIVQSGFSHLKLNLYLIAVNLVVFLIILIYREFKFLQIPLFILSLFLYYRITKMVDRKMPFAKEKNTGQ